MKSFGLTDKGKVRKDNQDCFIIEKCPSKSCMIVVLCDGMGGAKAGGIASQLSNKAFVSYIYTKLTSRTARTADYRRILTSACTEANGVSYEYSHFDDAFNGMGTTIVGGVIKYNGNGYIINVGDSRAYLIGKRRIAQITRDHSLVEDMVSRGKITRAQAQNHPQKNIITRAVGVEASVSSDLFDVKLSSGNRILLCSDGLSNIVSSEEMLLISGNNQNLEKACEAFLDLAMKRGAPDNVTVFLAER